MTSDSIVPSPPRRSVLGRLRDWNVAASWATTPHGLWESRGFAIYEWVARALLGEPGVNRVADVGGGRTWHFGNKYRAANPDFHLIGLDVDASELALNPDLDEAIAIDICDSFGIEDNSLDLILCRATVEHLHDTGAFLANVHRALRPGCKAAFVFAGKWAPPMAFNRLIGNRVANGFLRRLVPGTEGYGGFRAHYDLCTHSAFSRKARELGFAIDYEYSSYYSSSYFQFFLPLHMLSLLFDYLRQMISIRDLASMNLFVLRKE